MARGNLAQVIRDYTLEEWRKLPADKRKELMTLGVVKYKELNESVQVELEEPEESEKDKQKEETENTQDENQ